jgi:hypothetical protein
MQVVIIASKDNTDPTALSCRSVTVATPTPKRSTERDSWILRLNFFLKKRVSKITVHGMIASFVI